MTEDPRCGTYAGRSAHRKAGTPTCDACNKANARYQRRYRKVRALYGESLIPAFGTTRRIHALMRLGWSITVIAERAGISRAQLWETTQQERVTRPIAAKVASTFEALSMSLPPANTWGERISAAKVRAHSERMGYVPPLAWDDIDDPDEQPTGWQYRQSGRADILRDLDELHAGLSEACARLDVSRDALEKWCERNEMRDLYVRFVARENQHREAS